MKAAKIIGGGIAVLIVIAGIGALFGEGEQDSKLSAPADKTAQKKTETEDVSPVCETVREELRDEEGPNPPGEGAYLAEDKELVKEECGPAARERWAEIQQDEELTPQERIEKAGREETEQAGEEREFEEGIKEAERQEQRERETRPSGESKWEELAH